MLKLAAICGIFAIVVSAVDFSCPTNPITNQPLEGNLPTKATDLVIVPKGANCTYNFQIPDGYALQLLLSANFKSDNDTVKVVDNLRLSRALSHANNPVKDAVIWISSGSSQINVIGVTGTSSFMAKYKYTPLNNFVKASKQTGQLFALNSVRGLTYYTITSAKDQVIATVGRHSTDDVDAVLENIYVYDGDNITTAKMVGRLSDLGLQNTVSSSGMSLSLVNFYNTSSKSYVLGNDASIVKKYNKYSVMLTSKGSEVKGRLVDGSVYGSGYTFYCLDCNEFYLKQLLFDNLGTYNTGFVTLQGQTPTHNMDRLIKYTSQTFTHNQLPQYIPSNVFTMTVSMSFVNITASAVNDDTAWKKAFDGRQGYIFSPRLWDPSNVKNSFDFELRNDSTQLNYQLDLDRMKLDKNMDVLTLQIGSGSGKSPAVNNLYPRDFSSTGIVSSNGNYMKVGFNGTVAAQVRLSFVVTAAKSAANVGILVSLALISYFNLFLC